MKLVIAYDGRPFHGWQQQREHTTIQGEIERALAGLFQGRRIPVIGAGRTDAGVHAAGQVAHIDPPGPIPAEALVRGLNSRLTPEIRILSARTVDPSFHARKSALGKRYTYRARWHAPTPPWRFGRAATIRPVSDLSTMQSALDLFVGRCDWASFTVPDPGPESTVRTIFSVRTRLLRGGFDLEFIGEGFLRYQVRRMVGALLEVAHGDRSLTGFEDLIVSPQPGAQIRTAEAHGLSLEHVYYRACPAVTNQEPAGIEQTLW
jgi:tRNA pseudouridine38-40 synthase